MAIPPSSGNRAGRDRQVHQRVEPVVPEDLRVDPVAAMADLPTFDGFTDLIGLPEVRDLETRFAES